MTGDMRHAVSDLPTMVQEADHSDLARVVLAVAAMHEPDRAGRCRHCQPARWWRRRPAGPCPTRRMLVAQLFTLGSPSWRSA